MLKVSIVIPAWNGEALLKKNLPQMILARKNALNNIIEIIVVDDGSTDGTSSLIRQEFAGEVKLIRHKVNRGFSATVNTGIRMAKGDVVCLLNQDVYPTTDFLVKALYDITNPDVFGVSLHEKGYGPNYGRFENGFIIHAGQIEKEKSGPTFWISGGSGTFRRDLWMRLGGMDEALFSPFYWEDVDICYRAMKRGYKLLWEPISLVTHNHESTINPVNFNSKRLNIVKERNQLLFIWKNLTSKNLFRKHIVGLVQRTVRHPGYIRVVFAALGKLKIVLKRRKKEMLESKISDEAIFSRFKNL